MAHFAELDESDIVINVIVVGNENCLDPEGNFSEAVGIAFCQSVVGADSVWVQTSYSASFRKKFAQPGDSYDPVNNWFMPPQPAPDCVFDEEAWRWDCPVPDSEPVA